jgi:iron complex outermembrane receptor protein
LLAVSGTAAHAQQPVRADTTRDTTKVRQLPEINVTVTRSQEPLSRVPFAVGVLDRDALQRGQQTLGIDEALNNLPGVVVSNRFNFSLDQRISIRGFGSRSNFGVRGLKILLDGIPQTLPDGQSQLTNIDFADVDRAEVLRGASSSLYGNASGGVISFQTQQAATGPFAQRIRVQGGSGERNGDDFYKWQSWTSGRSGSVSGTLSVSQFKADGFRQHSAAEFRQLNAGVDYAVTGSTLATLRLSLADDPRAENPGALTLAEYLANPDSAAATNIRRGADKDAQQQQAALGLRHFDAAGNEYDVTVFGVLRDLANPLAAPPALMLPLTVPSAVPGSAPSGGWGRANKHLDSPRGPTFSACETTARMWFRMPGYPPRPFFSISVSRSPSLVHLPSSSGAQPSSSSSALGRALIGCGSRWPIDLLPMETTAMREQCPP